MYSVAEVVEQMNALSAELDAADGEVRRMVHEFAEAEATYKRERAKAFLVAKSHGATDKEGDARAEETTNHLRRDATLKEALYRSARESAESKRSKLSAFQTIVAMIRSEMDLTRTSPHM